MLRAGAKPADEQRDDQHREPRTRARKAIAEPGEGGAEREHSRRAKPFGQQPGWNLEARHGADENAAQEAELGVAETELRPPRRQQDIDEVGIAVVQRM